MNDYVEQAIEFAKEFADAAPEKFQEVAFQSALQYFFSANNDVKYQKPSKGKKKSSKSLISKSKDALDEILQGDYDWSKTQVRALQPLGQYLLLLKIARDDFEIHILSSEEIKKILNEKFRINKTINTIGMSLMGVLGKYVDRIKRGNEFCYKLTSIGEEHLANMIRKLGD